MFLTLGAAAACGQDEDEPLRLEGLYPVGVRNNVTEAWGTLQFGIENRSDVAKQARIVVYYSNQPDLQYVRDVWVPARARRMSWLSLGPAPEQAPAQSRELAYQLFDRTDGANRLVRRREPERLLTRGVLYARREPSTALYLDSTVTEETDPFSDAARGDDESLQLVRTFRETRGLSERVPVVSDRFLPPTAEALDGLEHFVLAGNRLAADPPGRQVLRHWVLKGGTLWVLLDRVDPDVVAPVLGDDMRFQVVGRTSLTTVHLHDPRQKGHVEKVEYERPVDLVRVALAGTETVLFEANGWPAAFSQPVGRGRVVFTTLGARAWFRARTRGDRRSRFEQFPNLPIANDALYSLARRLQPEHEPTELGAADLAPVLAAEIGYEVVGRRTATVILVAFLIGLLALAIGLRRSRVPELIGLAAPLVALVAAAVLVGLGMNARRAVPPTAAAVAVVAVSPDNREEQWRGLFAVYTPESGVVPFDAPRGGQLTFDASGLESHAQQRVETDIDNWRWENLSFPSGVRSGAFQSTRPTGASVSARFGPTGLDGRLTAGAFRNLADAVLETRTGALLSVRLSEDGSFHVDSTDALPADQYLPGAVLTDRQQRRQELYRKLFAGSKPEAAPDRDRLFVWAEADELPFVVPGAARTVGAVLLITPIRYENSGDGPVVIPKEFVPFVVVDDGPSHAPKPEYSDPIRMRLRFQLPEQFHAFTIERAKFGCRVRVPERKFAVFGLGDGPPVRLMEQSNPNGPHTVEITDPRFLRTDSGGGVLVELDVSERIGPDGQVKPVGVQEPQLKWSLGDLGLEVTGRGAGK